jgi:adenine specific DNA methylase Mod
MRVKDDFVLRQVMDTNIIVPIGSEALQFKKMISLNETGVFIWTLLHNNITEEEIVDAICKEYNVSKECATQDVVDFIAQLNNINALIK